MRKTKKGYRKSKKSLTVSRNRPVFGIWYLMINFPLITFVKSGITSDDTSRRASQIDRDAPGYPIPVFFVPTFGHYYLEQWSHRAFSSFAIRYYKGDGHTEWFWLPVAIPIIFVMACIWFAYLWAVAWLITGDAITGASTVIEVLRRFTMLILSFK